MKEISKILLSVSLLFIIISCSKPNQHFEKLNRILNNQNKEISIHLELKDSLKIKKVSISNLLGNESTNSFLSEQQLNDLKEAQVIEFNKCNWHNITLDLNVLSNLYSVRFLDCSFRNVKVKYDGKKALTRCLFLNCNFDTLDLSSIKTNELSCVKSSANLITLKTINTSIKYLRLNYSEVEVLDNSISNLVNLNRVNLFKMKYGNVKLDLSLCSNLSEVVVDRENNVKLKVKQKRGFVLSNNEHYGFMDNDCLY